MKVRAHSGVWRVAGLMLGLWALTAPAATNYYVATNGGNTTHDSWSAAYTNIQDALDAAASNDTICLAGHTFLLTNQLTWTSSYVTIRGGYAATNDADQPGPYDAQRWPTVINATGASNRVMTITNVAGGTLERVTLTGGFPPVDIRHGGGVAIWNCTAMLLSGCVIASNSMTSGGSSTGYGGGLYSKSSTLVISNCWVGGNTSSGGGSGSGSRGGGIAIYGGQATLRDVVIANNQCATVSYRFGGGVYVGNSGTCVLRNCLVSGNSSQGSVYCRGDGLYLESGATRLENCTVASNTGQGIRQAGGTVVVTNCIVWGNGDDIGGTVTLAASDIEDGDGNGVGGCISADPLFEGGYYLATGSPCVDLGTNNASDWGLSGGYTTRSDGSNDSGRVDMGYHYTTGFDLSYADLFVATNGDNGKTGTNWAEAFRTITKALTVVRDGSRIHLAAGMYTTNSGESFPLTMANLTGVQMLGTNRLATVINAAGSSNRVMTITNSGNVRVSEVTLTGGSAPTNSPYGGGVAIWKSGGVLLSGCAINNNSIASGPPGAGLGGGLYVYGSAATINGCWVSSNTAVGNGGGYGSRGGGIAVDSSTDTMLQNSIIADNQCSPVSFRYGGGLYAYLGEEGSCVLRNCLVCGNSTRGSPFTGGDGLYLLGSYGNGSARLENCTVANNTGANEGIRMSGTSTLNVSMTNCIVWANGDDLATGIVTAVTLAYCDIQTTDAFWTNGVNGCTSVDPLFVNTNTANYRVKKGSPCINGGINLSWMAGVNDLDGNRRIQAGVVDLGCYEACPLGTVFVVY